MSSGNELFDQGNWPGLHMTGEKGTESVIRFSQLLDKKELLKVNEQLSSDFNKFQPWMSSYGKDFLVELSEIVSFEKSSITNDLKALEQRKKLLSDGNGENLKRIYPACSGSYRISNKKEKVANFNSEINECLSFLYGLNKRWASIIPELSYEFILREECDPNFLSKETGTGLSTHLYRKGIFLTLPSIPKASRFELLLNLVHEIGHQTMIVYQNFDSFLVEDIKVPVYSVVRKTYRPAILSFHALVATLFMVEFVIQLDDNDLNGLVSREYFLNRKQELIDDLAQGIKTLRNCNLTRFGKEVLDESIALLAYAQLKQNEK